MASYRDLYIATLAEKQKIKKAPKTVPKKETTETKKVPKSKLE